MDREDGKNINDVLAGEEDEFDIEGDDSEPAII